MKQKLNIIEVSSRSCKILKTKQDGLVILNADGSMIKMDARAVRDMLQAVHQYNQFPFKNYEEAVASILERTSRGHSAKRIAEYFGMRYHQLAAFIRYIRVNYISELQMSGASKEEISKHTGIKFTGVDGYWQEASKLTESRKSVK